MARFLRSGRFRPSALPERAMNKLLVGLLGATALATTLVLVRQQREATEPKAPRVLPNPGDTPSQVSLDRLRALGF